MNTSPENGFDDIIRDVAVRHGITIGQDDPLLVLHTLNDRMLEKSAALQKENLENFKKELSDTAYAWNRDAGTLAEKALNAAVRAGRETISAAADENARRTADAVRKEIDAVLSERLARTLETARLFSIINIVAAGLTGIAALLVLTANIP